MRIDKLHRNSNSCEDWELLCRESFLLRFLSIECSIAGKRKYTSPRNWILRIENLDRNSNSCEDWELSSHEIPADRMQRCWTALLRENIQVPEIQCWEYYSEGQTSFEQSSQLLHSHTVRIESSLLLRFLLIECSVAGRPPYEKMHKSQKFNIESAEGKTSFEQSS